MAFPSMVESVDKYNIHDFGPSPKEGIPSENIRNLKSVIPIEK